MGRREDRQAASQVAFLFCVMLLVCFGGVLFPPLWLVFLVPPVIWLVREVTAARDRRRSRREDAEQARMRGVRAGWYQHAADAHGVLRWWDGRVWGVWRWDARVGRYAPPVEGYVPRVD